MLKTCFVFAGELGGENVGIYSINKFVPVLNLWIKNSNELLSVTVGGIIRVGEPIIWCVGVFANQGITKLASAVSALTTYTVIVVSTEY